MCRAWQKGAHTSVNLARPPGIVALRGATRAFVRRLTYSAQTSVNLARRPGIVALRDATRTLVRLH